MPSRPAGGSAAMQCLASCRALAGRHLVAQQQQLVLGAAGSSCGAAQVCPHCWRNQTLTHKASGAQRGVLGWRTMCAASTGKHAGSGSAAAAGEGLGQAAAARARLPPLNQPQALTSSGRSGGSTVAHQCPSAHLLAAEAAVRPAAGAAAAALQAVMQMTPPLRCGWTMMQPLWMQMTSLTAGTLGLQAGAQATAAFPACSATPPAANPAARARRSPGAGARVSLGWQAAK